MEQDQFSLLLHEYLAGTISAERAGELLSAMEDAAAMERLQSIINDQLNNGVFNQNLALPQTHGRIQAKLQEAIAAPPARRIRLWQRMSAIAAVLLVAVGIGIWLTGRTPPHYHAQHIPQHIQPGKQGAILTLANGKQILLDSMGNGTVAIQNGTEVRLHNGQLHYKAAAAQNEAVAFNTVSTPRGRQFHLVLPDGSMVWLNAASTVTFPAAFTGTQRVVKITGEAYFEVAADAHRPFMVQSKDSSFTQVLGTRFNINAYPEESYTTTTLLQGSVRAGNHKTAIMLQPGEQAAIHLSAIQPVLVKQADTEQVMAWKNGYFDFNNLPLEQVMRQLARWYNLEIVYEKGVPDIHFGGKLSRNVSFEGLIKGLEKAGLRFRIHGERTLVILP